MTCRCAFLTLEDRAGFYVYDHALIGPLASAGWKAEEIPWNREGIDWRDFDAVVIRSTWDYQASPEKFLLTLDAIGRATRLFNPVVICRWNMSKRYLRELEDAGVPIVPTAWCERLEKAAIDTAHRQFDSEKVVAKPLIGANADDVFVLDRHQKSSGHEGALEVFADRPVMLQPFVESVLTRGETSLFYFGGEYSHAIQKHPAQGDFRVQEEHGGSFHAVEPHGETVRLGNALISKLHDTLGKTLLYARVDFVELASGVTALMEVELIEPSLYFEECPDGIGNFVRHFLNLVATD